MRIILSLIALSLFIPHAFALNLALPTEIDYFAFGSCNKAGLPQDHWQVIKQNNPQLWLWLGDNYYGNTADTKLLRARSLEVKNHPDYMSLRQSVPIIGTWDDHDYGKNNAGKEWEIKKQSQQIMLDFLDEEKNSPRREQEGIYTSYSIGSPGKRVKFLLLDVRYHLSTKKPKDVLGSQQWHWLENELTNSDAQIHFIVTGMSALQWSARFFYLEGWSSFKESRRRLNKILEKSKAKGIFFLTGDRHFASIYEARLPGGKRTYVEFMSSGLTHAKGGKRPFWARGYDEKLSYWDRHFATIRINWKTQPAELTFTVRNLKNESVIQKTYPAL